MSTKKQRPRAAVMAELNKLRSAAERDAMIERASALAEKSFHENSFAERILDLKMVEPDDLIPSPNHPGLSDIVYLEPDARGMILGWNKDRQDAQYVSAQKAEIPYTNVQTPDMFAVEEELVAGTVPMTTYFKKIGVDLSDGVDGHFIMLAKKCAALTRQYSVVEGPFGKQHMRVGCDAIDRNRKQAATFLIPSTSHNALCAGGADFFGTFLNAEVQTRGYQYPVAFGRKLITTNRCDLLTVNPYAPTVDDAVAIGTGSSKPVHDPAYPFGTNLSGLSVNGNADLGKYPRKPLINGHFIAGISSKKSGTNATAPTTMSWKGNTNFVFTSPEFLGKYGMLRDVQVYFQQQFRKLSWGGHLIMGLGITQVDSVSMVVSV